MDQKQYGQGNIKHNQDEIKPQGFTQEDRILNAAEQYVDKCSDTEKLRLKKLADAIEKEASAPSGGNTGQAFGTDQQGGKLNQGQGQGLHQAQGQQQGQGGYAGGKNTKQNYL